MVYSEKAKKSSKFAENEFIEGLFPIMDLPDKRHFLIFYDFVRTGGNSNIALQNIFQHLEISFYSNSLNSIIQESFQHNKWIFISFIIVTSESYTKGEGVKLLSSFMNTEITHKYTCSLFTLIGKVNNEV